jgi:hypothetical protein
VSASSQLLEGRQGDTVWIATQRRGNLAKDFRHQTAVPAIACGVRASHHLRSVWHQPALPSLISRAPGTVRSQRRAPPRLRIRPFCVLGSGGEWGSLGARRKSFAGRLWREPAWLRGRGWRREHRRHAASWPAWSRALGQRGMRADASGRRLASLNIAISRPANPSLQRTTGLAFGHPCGR